MPPQEWIAKFKGYFDKGGDEVREETLARQIEQGVVPPNTKLTERPQERHATQSFEMFGNRAISTNDWMANTTPLRAPCAKPELGTTGANPDDFQWELYNVAEDFSQANNLAAENPAKLKQLQGIFDRESMKYNVYPLDATFGERADLSRGSSLTRGPNLFTYYPGTIRVPEAAAIDW